MQPMLLKGDSSKDDDFWSTRFRGCWHVWFGQAGGQVSWLSCFVMVILLVNGPGSVYGDLFLGR
jgi:hypothetical protein